MSTNQYLAGELEGLDSFVQLGGALTFGDAFNALLALLEPEHTQEHRGHLDQISPAAHRQLIRELRYLQSLAPGLADGTAAIINGDDVLDDLGGGPDIYIIVEDGVISATTVP